MAIRPKHFTVNRDLSYNGHVYKAGDAIEGVALRDVLRVRADCVDSDVKPSNDTSTPDQKVKE